MMPDPIFLNIHMYGIMIIAFIYFSGIIYHTKNARALVLKVRALSALTYLSFVVK